MAILPLHWMVSNPTNPPSWVTTQEEAIHYPLKIIYFESVANSKLDAPVGPQPLSPRVPPPPWDDFILIFTLLLLRFSSLPIHAATIRVIPSVGGDPSPK